MKPATLPRPNFNIHRDIPCVLDNMTYGPK